MFIGQSVKTPYGKGIVKSIRDHDDDTKKVIIVQPTSWTLDRGQRPVFYMNPSDVHPLYHVGAAVKTAFGVGAVVKVRSEDGIYVVHLENWFLATNVSPVLYLNESALSLAPETVKEEESSKPISAMDELLIKAKDVKMLANSLFKSGDFEEAKNKYVEVLMILRYGPEISVSDKAKVLEQIIPCNNNISICAFKLSKYHECIVFASNALHMIENLEKGTSGDVVQALNDLGVTSEELFKKLKRKSLYYLGYAKYNLKEHEDAHKYLLEANELISPGEQGSLPIIELLQKVSKAVDKEFKKAKATWSKAFKKIGVDEESESVVTTPSTSPVKSAVKTEVTPSVPERLPENEISKPSQSEPPASASIIANALLVVTAIACIGFVVLKIRGLKK